MVDCLLWPLSGAARLIKTGAMIALSPRLNNTAIKDP